MQVAATAAQGPPPLILTFGFGVEDNSETEHFAQALYALKQAATLAEAAGVTLLLEPLNTKLFAAIDLVSTRLVPILPRE